MNLTLTALLLPVLTQDAFQVTVNDPGALEHGLSTIDASEIQADLYFIASDALEGRNSPSRGLEIAARFIRNRLQRLGISPGARFGYFHEYPLRWRQLDATTSGLTVLRDGSETRLEFGEDYFFARSSEMADLSAEGRGVSIGYGSTQEIADAKLEGRWAVCREAESSLRRIASRVEEAGAVGLCVLPKVGTPAVERFGKTAGWVLDGSFGGVKKDVFPRVYLSEAAESRVLQGELSDAGTVLDFGLRERRYLTHPGAYRLFENVCGLWPGSHPELSKEVIVISAHYDHDGIKGGVIYNGADDNGSGTVGLLALAEALVEYGPMRRSILLQWVSAEEKGLLGSGAWTKRPWLPEGHRPVANVNIDMIGRNRPDDLMITPTRKLGREYNHLVTIAEANRKREGFGEFRSADDYWMRSDHMNYAVNLDLPVAFLFADIHEDYHQPGDDPEKIDYDKIRRAVRLVMRMLDGMQADELVLSEKVVPTLAEFEVKMRAGIVLDDLERLRAAVWHFARLNGGRLPRSLEILVTPDENGATFLGREELPVDPWGNAYVYRVDGSSLVLTCLGADGAAGGEGEAEDVVVE